jgi:hypothetical protein
MTREERTLDLHGHHAAEAIVHLSAELARAHLERCGTLIVIHGRGWHSGGKAVLPRVVRDFLSELELHPRSGVRRVRFGELHPIAPNPGCVYVDLFLERGDVVFDPGAPKKKQKGSKPRPVVKPPDDSEIEFPADLDDDFERGMRDLFGR